jgi:hypothetical protein
LLQAVKYASITNSTFFKNSAPGGSAVAMVAGEENAVPTVDIENSIFWKNLWTGSPDSNQSEIWVPQVNKNNSVILNLHNCIVQGGTNLKSKGVRIQDVSRVHTEFSRILTVDPKLRIEKERNGLEGKDKVPCTDDDGLDLDSGSPAIDAGKLVPALETDIRGKPRTSGKSTDIGAYEH